MTEDEQRTLARLEADRNEIDTQIRLLSPRLPNLLPVEMATYSWLRQRRKDLTTQIEEMQS